MAILLFAVVDFGMALYQRHLIANAVSDAATMAARDRTSDEDSIEADLQTFSHGYLTQDDADDAYIVIPCAMDEDLIVEVSKPYELISPLQGLLNLTSGGSAPTLEIDLEAKTVTRRSAPCS
jgi:hypothetical protein